jgi:hypothetical protein
VEDFVRSDPAIAPCEIRYGGAGGRAETPMISTLST